MGNKPAANQPRTGNIHIDRISVNGPLDHPHLGEGFYKAIDDETTVLVGASAFKPKVKRTPDDVYMRSKELQSNGRAYRLELDCCPPQKLQKHNFFGHSDMVDYTYAMFDQQTRNHKIYVEPDQRHEWRTGQVGLTETALTGNFFCPEFSQIPIIDAIDQNNVKGKHRDIESCISLGFTDKRRSNHHSAVVYHKGILLEQEWPKPGRYRRDLIRLGYSSIRVEMRIFSRMLKELGLEYVYRWANVDVQELFFKLLARYNIRNAIQRLLTPDEEAMLSRAERRAYLLWLNGEDLKNHYSRSTVHKYVHGVRDKTTIDMRGARRPDSLPLLDLTEVLRPETLVPIPDWAYGTPHYWEPGMAFLRNEDDMDDLTY